MFVFVNVRFCFFFAWPNAAVLLLLPPVALPAVIAAAAAVIAAAAVWGPVAFLPHVDKQQKQRNRATQRQ